MKTIGIDISVLSDQNKTGIAVYTYQLLDNLFQLNKTDRFILFGIATFQTFEQLKNIDFKKYPNVSLKIYKLPARSFRRVFMLWQKFNLPKIEQFIGKVDIFHSINWFMPPQVSGKKVASIFDLTSLTHPGWHDPRTTQLDLIRFNRIIKEVDLIITISENSKKEIEKYQPKGRIEVIYPAASEIFTQKVIKSEREKVMKKFNLKQGYILSVSTLEPRKNLEGLVKAYIKSEVQQQLVLVGKMGWKNSELLDLIEQNKDQIKTLGFITDEELKVLYQEATCLVYPSFYEGFGIPVLEAMSCGTAVICSNTSSLPEVGGDAALYINPEKIDEITQAINILMGSETLRKKHCLAGLKQAKKFSWKGSAQQLNRLYQSL